MSLVPWAIILDLSMRNGTLTCLSREYYNVAELRSYKGSTNISEKLSQLVTSGMKQPLRCIPLYIRKVAEAFALICRPQTSNTTATRQNVWASPSTSYHLSARWENYPMNVDVSSTFWFLFMSQLSWPWLDLRNINRNKGNKRLAGFLTGDK